jgi:ABC-2 type transport system ATP-binding protein
MTIARAALPAGPFLQVSRARVSFGSRTVLDDLDLAIAEGEILVLLGPNGAGKSTLIKTIAGRLVPQSGSVRIGGRDPARSSQARRVIGIVPQNIAVFERLTALENLIAFGALMGLPRRDLKATALSILNRVGLSERARDRVGTLSGGMRRRVNIAASLMHKPTLLVLDEPTAGVDPASRAELVRLLRSLRDDGLAILLTTHDMEEAEALADRVAVIVAGRIMAVGTPETLVEELFGPLHQLSITIGPSVSLDDALRQELRDMGLTGESDGRTFSGLLDTRNGEVAAFVHEAIGAGAAVAEVRVRRPGLGAVLDRFRAC